MSESPQRADAVRNRAAVLVAADAMFARDGSWERVSMRAVAEAAGVGKGTVFRAFGDRAGLLRALMAHRSEQLVAAVGAGVPPFAVGADPVARVTALLDALLTFKLANRQLFLALDGVGAGSPYQAENYGWWHEVLVSALGDRFDDAGFLAHAMLASVRSDLLEHLITVESRTEGDLRTGVGALVARVVGIED